MRGGQSAGRDGDLRFRLTVKRFYDEPEGESLELMSLIARSELDDWNPYQTKIYAAAAVLFFVLAMICIHFRIGIGFEGKNASYHQELIPSRALCYIDGGRLIELPDGNYPVAMPSGAEALTIDGQKKFPLLMVMVPTADGLKLYPLNVADDSFLPRQGRMLALNILMGFTSAHAENRLQYGEKLGNVEDYKRKAYYYIEVRRGVGRMRRGYKTARDLDPIRELSTIYNLIKS